MLAFTILITGMVVAIRFLAENLHPLEIAFFRNLFGLVALVPLVVRNGVQPLKTRKIGLIGLRGVLNAASLMLFFLAVTLVPVAEIAAYSFTTPLFVTVMAVLFLQERMGTRRWAGLFLGFLGAMVVLRPGAGAISVGAIYALGSAAFWALTIVVIKILSRSEASVTITFYGVLILIPITFAAALPFWKWPSAEELLWMALLGTAWITAQLCLTQALKYADAGLVMPFDFAKLIWAAIAGFIFFTEVPSVWTWIGSGIIFAAATYVAYRERRARRRPAEAPAVEAAGGAPSSGAS
ncbi:MAG: RNA polymerase subunit sigma-54 [Rhodospirillaceae bacterium]|jgi:drug/metabolite transporter (DMT)-like permease|nr:RNA polymerase subunit sigma-54 [Rhodospirillaceae bacterium]|tara:strand:- start:2104 stop:2988 length:885 start_codon:yes stop_codon:yes gene_type:complete